MFDQKSLALLRQTLEKTKAKKLEWKETAQPGQFLVAIEGKYTLRVYPFTTTDSRGNEVGGPSLTLLDGDHNLVLDVTENIAGINASELADLYELVRRQVLRVDEKVDDAIDFLKNL